MAKNKLPDIRIDFDQLFNWLNSDQGWSRLLDLAECHAETCLQLTTFTDQPPSDAQIEALTTYRLLQDQLMVVRTVHELVKANL